MAFVRKKILIMSDSGKIDTGFGRVTREIWSGLSTNNNKYEVVSIGWFHQESSRDVPYPVYQTMKADGGGYSQEDKYAHISFPKCVDSFKPDLVWTLGDMWMTDHVKSAGNRKTFKWVGYFPIDGMPSPSKWGEVVEDMDVAVAYGKYGMDVIRERAPDANLKYIYHGVNTSIFKPFDPEVRKALKKQILGVDRKLVIGIVARNQPRKSFDMLFKAYYHILSGEYVRCENCGKLSVSNYDLVNRKPIPLFECPKCGSKDITFGKKRDDVILYLHCAPKDCGWDLIDLQEDYHLRGKIIFNPELQIGRGVPETTLAAVYNTFDIFTLPTRGEGFGLPILEAMSCGVPVVATDYSAHTEWARDCSILVSPAALEAEPLTNIRRAVIDIDKYVEALLFLLDNKEERDRLGKLARAQAEKMDWGPIIKQWEQLIDSVLFPEGTPEDSEITNVQFRLEEI